MALQKGKLFLIPSPINENGMDSISPESTGIMHSIDHFIVERVRTARRYVAASKHPKAIDDILFEEIPEGELHKSELEKMLHAAIGGKNIGLMSEAGLPAVADPGSQFVRTAHRLGLQVVPLPGPSSIMMALMGSGLEGQRFAFHGYLSAKKNELPAQLRFLDMRLEMDDATQIWIEAPYRNRQILEAVDKNIAPQRRFCIAAGLGNHDGFVMTRELHEWKKIGWPEIHKVPAVFLLGG